ncbi:unnamed protein product [Brachionus calyciflorus]|uniref:poly(ADP-ribose) glycohydrolase n=1 Tax=Brachionus calyciflorus TaxID=104777 RepID=A0A813SD50_9BILA|nr:unnamed protein product [Brachionus calyciflorus]
MIYNFDFTTHDELELLEETIEERVDSINIDSSSVENLELNDPFSEFNQSEYHTILFKEDSDKVFSDEWNDEYVKLPCSQSNFEDKHQSLWPKICDSLTKLKKEIEDSSDVINFGAQLFAAVNDYNSTIQNFDNLSLLFQEINLIDEIFDKENILKNVMPKVIDLALKLPELIQKKIPILKSGKTHSISITQEQCACLLANAFFCTFPSQRNLETLPFINFDRLFMKSDQPSDITNLEKLKCILHYFKRIIEKLDSKPETISYVTYCRISNPNVKNAHFLKSKKKIRVPIISNCSRIEECKGALQLDFASKLIGSNVLSTGCVQEEIRFSICPEFIVSMVFTESLDDDECVIIRGAERFSSYNGYDESFKWTGDFVDNTERDKFNRIMTDVLAIDPLFFEDPLEQYREDTLWREVKKCYVGFSLKSRYNLDDDNLPRIATGNWGCGAFNGNKELKFLIQIIVASEVNRDLVYYTFDNKETCKNMIRIIDIIQKNSLEVGQVYRILNRYCHKVQKFLNKSGNLSPTVQFKDFIISFFNLKKNDSLVDYFDHHSKKN